MLILGTSYITEKILPRIKNKFWIDVFLAHKQISRKIIPTEVEQFLACPIFYNENIKIGNKTIYNKSCIENGIKFINDITIENGNIYTYHELRPYILFGPAHRGLEKLMGCTVPPRKAAH